MLFARVRRVVEISLRSRLKVASFLLVIGIPSVLLAVESVRIALATSFGNALSIVEMKKAVSLDPANPDLHFRLGTAETYDMEGFDYAEGIRQLERATELSPHDTRYWGALASACEFEGNKNRASHAIARTLALSPMTPRIHWEAANYYLWSNHQELALSQFRRLLELDANYAGATFRASLGAVGDPGIVYSTVLTPASGSKLKLAYINFLSSHGYGDFAFQVWKELVAGKAAFDFSAADPYLEYLIGARKYEEAMSVWNDLESRGLVRQSGDSNDLVFNGGFEHVPLNAGFDWRYHQEPDVAIDFKGHHPYEGKRCLQLDFSDVENHQEEPVNQIVPVRADQTYVLTVEVRSNNITSDSGPRLRVTDPACRECLNASSDAVVGTTSWHQVYLKFRTGPQTSAVRLSVWRARSLGYPTEILGTLWLDQVSLRAVAPVPAQITQRRGTF